MVIRMNIFFTHVTFIYDLFIFRHFWEIWIFRNFRTKTNFLPESLKIVQDRENHLKWDRFCELSLCFRLRWSHSNFSKILNNQSIYMKSKYDWPVELFSCLQKTKHSYKLFEGSISKLLGRLVMTKWESPNLQFSTTRAHYRARHRKSQSHSIFYISSIYIVSIGHIFTKLNPNSLSFF